jgi:hypothetical protein
MRVNEQLWSRQLAPQANDQQRNTDDSASRATAHAHNADEELLQRRTECECALAARELPIILHGSANLRDRSAMDVHKGVGRAYASQYAMYEQLYRQMIQMDTAPPLLDASGVA